jgi:hypothetical protein
MTNHLPGPAQWTDETPPSRGQKHRSIACVELITTFALALSTAVAATAVSIGIARAEVIDAAAKTDGTPLAIALFLGLLLAGMGVLTVVAANDRARRD